MSRHWHFLRACVASGEAGREGCTASAGCAWDSVLTLPGGVVGGGGSLARTPVTALVFQVFQEGGSVCSCWGHHPPTPGWIVGRRVGLYFVGVWESGGVGRPPPNQGRVRGHQHRAPSHSAACSQDGFTQAEGPQWILVAGRLPIPTPCKQHALSAQSLCIPPRGRPGGGSGGGQGGSPAGPEAGGPSAQPKMLVRSAKRRCRVRKQG